MTRIAVQSSPSAEQVCATILAQVTLTLLISTPKIGPPFTFLEIEMDWTQDMYDRRKNRGERDFSRNETRETQRRQSGRFQLRLWTEGRTEGRLDFHNCSNLSEEGIFIETTNPYPLHQIVELEFNLPGVQEPIRSSARVVSVLDEENAGPAIMGNGFVFERLGDAERHLIKTFLSAAELVE